MEKLNKHFSKTFLNLDSRTFLYPSSFLSITNQKWNNKINIIQQEKQGFLDFNGYFRLLETKKEFVK